MACWGRDQRYHRWRLLTGSRQRKTAPMAYVQHFPNGTASHPWPQACQSDTRRGLCAGMLRRCPCRSNMVARLCFMLLLLWHYNYLCLERLIWVKPHKSFTQADHWSVQLPMGDATMRVSQAATSTLKVVVGLRQTADKEERSTGVLKGERSERRKRGETSLLLTL